MPKSKKSKVDDHADDASEPYSDELNVSSPEVLEMDDEGEVILNSDWTRAERKKHKSKQSTEADIIDTHSDELEAGAAEDDGDSDGEETVSGSDQWESEEGEAPDADEEAQRQLSSVSFGTLAKAQSLGPEQTRKRKRDAGNDDADAKLAALRLRLKELQNGQSWKQKNDEDEQENSTEDDVDSDDGGQHDARRGRSSKHAPMMLSSKRQVTRKRHAVDVPKSHIRDPRFDPTTDLDRESIRKNYAFLDGYVDSEIKDIKSKLKMQKTPQAGSKKKKAKGAPKLTETEVEALKRELVQKESKRAAQAARDRHADVLKEHKKKERELVKSGKKAYFLKNSEVKQKVLTKQFEGMSEGKREKIMEKKRKRIASKERRFMPETRRST